MPQEGGVSAFEGRGSVNSPIEVFPNEGVAIDRGKAPVGHESGELIRPQVLRCLPGDEPVVEVLCTCCINADRSNYLVDDLVVKHFRILTIDKVLTVAVLNDEDE